MFDCQPAEAGDGSEGQKQVRDKEEPKRSGAGSWGGGVTRLWLKVVVSHSKSLLFLFLSRVSTLLFGLDLLFIGGLLAKVRTVIDSASPLPHVKYQPGDRRTETFSTAQESLWGW